MNNDLISREDLKKAILEHRNDYVDDNFFWTKLFNLIENAPTVERPQGEWIKNPDCSIQVKMPFYYACSVCGNPTRSNNHNFCPNCGARMKGWDEL